MIEGWIYSILWPQRTNSSRSLNSRDSRVWFESCGSYRQNYQGLLCIVYLSLYTYHGVYLVSPHHLSVAFRASL
jgi:hypothetical protein